MDGWMRAAATFVLTSIFLVCLPNWGQSFPSNPSEQKKIIGAFVEINDVWNELIPTVNELDELLPLLEALNQNQISKSTYLSEVTRKRETLRSGLRFAEHQIREITSREYGASEWASRIEQYDTEFAGVFLQLEALLDTTVDFFVSAPSLDGETESHYSGIMVDKFRIVTQLTNLSLRGDIAMVGEEHPNAFLLRAWEHQSNTSANLFELDHLYYYGSEDDLDRYLGLLNSSKIQLESFQNEKADGLVAIRTMKAEYNRLIDEATAREQQLIDIIVQMTELFVEAWSIEQQISDKYRLQIKLYETLPEPFPSDDIQQLDAEIAKLEDERWALFDSRLVLAQRLVDGIPN